MRRRIVTESSARMPRRTGLRPDIAECAPYDDRPLSWRRHVHRTSVGHSRALFAALRRADAGAATAEFAVVLPAVVAVAALLLCLSRAVIVSMDCQDAAAAGARELVVSDGDADAGAVVRAVAGGDATASVTYGGGTVTVVAQCPVVPDPLGVLPTRVSGTATGVMP